MANSLHINCSKSKVVLFRAKTRSFETSHKLILNNAEITLSQTVKTLGVHFHEHMAWNYHAEHISHKLCKVLGVLRRCQNILPVKQKLLVYNALFSSHLHYCHLVWSTGSKASSMNLVVLQKNALRCIEGVSYNAHTASIFAKYRILRITSYYEYQLLSAFKSEIRGGSILLCTLATLQPNPASRVTRYTETWHVPCSRTKYGFETLRYRLPCLMNKWKLTIDNVRILSKTEMLNRMC